MHSGITFLGKHSFKDFGLTMAMEREIGIPNKKKTKLTLPFSNVTYDYSAIYGSQTYEERTIKYSFNIADRAITSKDQMNWAKTELINWLMNSGGKQVLKDDFYRGYYFLAEIEGSSSFKENWEFGFLEVTFTAYPFMVCSTPEGADIWDEFNFLMDLSQDVKFQIPSSVYDYKELAVGSTATIGAWATGTVGGRPGELGNWVGVSGRIKARYNVEGSLSKRQYDVEGFSERIFEQDIIQACVKYLDVELINPGTPAVFPKVTMWNAGMPVPKVSVHNLDTGMVYNFLGQAPDNYLFQLKSGKNRLRLIQGVDGYNTDIRFTFNKELI